MAVDNEQMAIVMLAFCSVEGHSCKFDVVRDLFKPQRVTD